MLVIAVLTHDVQPRIRRLRACMPVRARGTLAPWQGPRAGLADLWQTATAGQIAEIPTGDLQVVTGDSKLRRELRCGIVDHTLRGADRRTGLACSARVRLERNGWVPQFAHRSSQAAIRPPRSAMLAWSIAFFSSALIAAAFGFGNLVASATASAKVLFFVFLCLFLLSLLAGLLRPGRHS
jgi:uncharacterized membrane protein YtjA (UPF0391 family)